MTATYAIPSQSEIPVGLNASQVRLGTNGVALAAPNDTHTLQLQFLEQIELVTMATATAAGTSGTITATFDFRWSTDGATWSAWATWSTLNVSALTPDPDDRFYLEIRLTRGGVGVGGVVTWTNCIFNVTRDPNACGGHGSLTDYGMQGELLELFRLMIDYKLPTAPSGGKRFRVVTTWPEQQSRAGGLVPVYVYQARKRNSSDSRVGGMLNPDPWELQVAVKTLGESKGPTMQGVTAYDYACGKIRVMFDNRSAMEETYSFTFKNVAFVGVNPWRFNINGLQVEDRGESVGDNDTYHIFSIKFEVNNNRIQYGYSTI